jgi:hypothetical protein
MSASSSGLISWTDAGGAVDQHTAAPGLISWSDAQTAPPADAAATTAASPAPVTSPPPAQSPGSVGPQVRGRFGMVNLQPQPVSGADYLGVANNAIDSATFGADRVIGPAIDSLPVALLRGESVPQAYDQVQDAMAASRQGLQQNNPTAAHVAQVLGAVASPINAWAAPLFAGAKAATLAGKALNAARNVGAGAAVGGAYGAGTSENTGAARVQDAENSALGGGVLTGAAGAIPAVVDAVRGAAKPFTDDGPSAVAGNVLNEFAGAPVTPQAPALHGLALNAAQATNNPGLAALARLQESTDQNAAMARITDQNAALRNSFTQPVGGAPPLSSGATMPAASAAYAGAVRTAQDLAKQHETALWQTPELSVPVKTAPVSDAINAAVKNLSPGARLGLTGNMQAIAAQAAQLPETSTLGDLNAFRSQLLKVARSQSVDPLQRLVAGKLADGVLTGMDALPEVQADPTIAAAYANARNFTHQSRQAFGFQPFQQILDENEQGNQEANIGAAASKLFDFGAGTPKNPEAMPALNDFLTGLRQRYAAAGQMGNAAQTTYTQMKIGSALRDYVAAAALDHASSIAPDASGAAKVQPNRLSDWINTNKPWLQTSGIFTDKQLQVLDRINQASQQVGRMENLRGTTNSTTYEKIAGHRFVDAFLSPSMRSVGGMAIGAGLGSLASHLGVGGEEGGAALGLLFGSEKGAHMIDKAYAPVRAKVMGLLQEAIRDPQVAADLMMKAKPSNVAFMSPKTRGMVQAIMASAGNPGTSSSAAPETGQGLLAGSQ